jgi:AcrR family transcriptional regulator
VTAADDAADRAAVIEAGVLAAVERLLAEGASFPALTMQRIADEARVARSTVYLRFHDKNALLVPLAAGLKGGAYEIMNGWSPAPADALDRLSDRLSAVIHYYRERAHVLRAVIEQPDTLSPFLRLSQDWIEGEQAAGRTAASVNAAVSARVIVHGGNEVIYQQVLSGDPDMDAEVARELAANQWFGAFRRR